MKRANASIGSGVVCLSNAWMERRWSTFTGDTTELLLSGVDSLTRKSPEYHIDYGAQALAVRDMGEPFWSEAVDAFGASIHLEQGGQGLHLRLTTYLSHTSPGLIRSLQLCNTGTKIASITRVANDVLALDRERFSPQDPSTEISIAADGASGTHTIFYRPLRSSGGTLWLGAGSKDALALFSPNPNYCAPLWQGRVRLEPGKVWTSPPTTLVWVPGNQLDAPLEGFNSLQQQWQELQERSQQGFLTTQRNPNTSPYSNGLMADRQHRIPST